MLPEKQTEFQLIEQYRQQVFPGDDVTVGIGDDAAVIRWPADGQGLVTTDMLLEGVHFTFPAVTPRLVGRKAMAVNLSDIAAMAGRPRFAVVSLALSQQQGTDVAMELFAGMREMAEQFKTAIIGGDTNSWSGPLVVNVTLIGETSSRGAVTRGGARPGDWILVTGELGGSILGRHFSFQPRIHEAAQLHAAADLHAMIDVSDGLAADLYHILEESAVGAVIDADSIPISAAAHRMQGESPLEHALGDGEDFELLFTVSPEDGKRLLAGPPSTLQITRIGEIIPESQCMLRKGSGELTVLPRMGWAHGIS